MNIYVGNLSTDVTEIDLENAFKQHGKVNSVKIIKDMFTQDSKGFGFVIMLNKTEAAAAMEKLNTTELKGKRIIVNEARPVRNKKGRNRGRR